MKDCLSIFIIIIILKWFEQWKNISIKKGGFLAHTLDIITILSDLVWFDVFFLYASLVISVTWWTWWMLFIINIILTFQTSTLGSTFLASTMTFTVFFQTMTFMAFAARGKAFFPGNNFLKGLIIGTVETNTLLSTWLSSFETFTVAFLTFCLWAFTFDVLKRRLYSR